MNRSREFSNQVVEIGEVRGAGIFSPQRPYVRTAETAGRQV